MNQSVFHLRAFLPVLLFCMLVGFSITLLYLTLTLPDDGSNTPGVYAMLILVILLFGFLMVWIVSEMKKKAVKVIIKDDRISATTFYGAGWEAQFNFQELDGYFTSQLPSNAGRSYEYLYILKDKRKVVILSEYYHRNYPEMKQILKRKLKFKGDRPFSLSGEMKEIIDG